MTQDQGSPPDDDERELIDRLQGAEWAFVWAILTICLIALAALAGWAWRTFR